MKYFVTDRERDGTCYHEFYKGRWDGKTFWKEDSISLHDNIMFQAKEFIAALVVCVSKYDPFGETEITADEWIKIGTLISSKDNISKKVYEEANKWAKEVFKSYGCFTILGL